MPIPKIVERHPSEAEHRKRMAESINGLRAGKLAAVGSFTLAAGGTTTTVSDNNFDSNMVVIWTPASANAAGALAGLYVSARTKGQFTLTHANTATLDRTFLYVRLG